MEGEGGTGLFRCVVARGFVAPPARTGSLGSWLSPQDPPQLHEYRQGELISRGCWAGLTRDRGHGAQPCPWTGRQAQEAFRGQSRSEGAAAPGR